ncbi:MAG: GNAT family N-acetyltransferase [Oscillospiraceae bacterium]|jgi:GNAT superfamily N-acetyltransferase|nr:GNAT family N-acetyltransferase [Oscillospiraceae bacterium]
MPFYNTSIHPQPQEEPQLKALWKTVFGDSDTVIDAFFATLYDPQTTLVARNGGAVVSALYLLDCGLSVLKKTYASFYLYAAATLPGFRGRGLMAELLSAAKEFALRRKKEFICLYPAEDSLYDFYQKHGYEPVFKTKEISLKGTSVRTLIDPFCEVRPLELDDFAAVRDAALSGADALFFDKPVLAFQKTILEAYGGQAFSAHENSKVVAYLLAEKDAGDSPRIKEALSVNGRIDAIAAILHQKFNLEEYTLPFPSGFQLSSDHMRLHSGGMALALSEEAKIIKERINSLYMGLNLG